MAMIVECGLHRPPPSLEIGHNCRRCPIGGLFDCFDQARFGTPPALIEANKGRPVAEAGARPRHVLAVIDGLVRLYVSLPDGRRLITGFRFGGEVLPCLDADILWHVTAEAVVPSVICQVDMRAFERLRAERPEIERKIAAVNRQEIAAANNHMVLLGLKTPLEKVATFLLELRDRSPRGDGRSNGIRIPMPRQDIGDYLGLQAETVSRAFSKLASEQAISIERPTLVVLQDLDRLSQLASGDHPRNGNGCP